MTHLSNEVTRHLYAHNHTNIQKRESYILRTVLNFFLILTFSALMVGLRLIKNRNLMFQPEYRVVLKACITIIMRIMWL